MYDPELIDEQVKFIKSKRGISFKRQAVFYGISVSELYKIRKGTRKSEKIAKLIDSTWEDINEKWYLVVLYWEGNYWYAERHVYRSYQGAKSKIEALEVLLSVEDSLITLNKSEASNKLKAWLIQYPKIKNRDEITNWIFEFTSQDEFTE